MAHPHSAIKADELSAPQRNNYYFGKLMDVLHFKLEQDYGMRKERLLNRLTLGEGVLCGLTLGKGTGSQICVARGAAVDAVGREIIVPLAACIDPWTLTDECGQPAGELSKTTRHVVHLCLSYRECATDFAPTLVTDCNAKEACAAGTIVESFRILVREGPPDAVAHPGVCEALLGTSSAPLFGSYELGDPIDTGGRPVLVAVSADGHRALVANE